MKWTMGWMNDTLRYIGRPHFFRKWHGDDIRFSAVYAFNENFILPLSHDEVVYGKGSLLERQPGDEWQCFAGLRALYGYMWTHPGKKLLFMGGEFAEPREWHHERALDWALWQQPAHAGVARWIADLNAAYRRVPALHALDFQQGGFAWAPLQPHDATVLAFFRRGGDGATVVAITNMTPAVHHGVRIGLPHAGDWHEILHGDAAIYGGSVVGNMGLVQAVAEPLDGQPSSALLTLPPLATLVLCDRPLTSFPPISQGAATDAAKP
jgi:1,4-alpha-glucan branching enzyme